MHKNLLFCIILTYVNLIVASHHPEQSANFFSAIESKRKDRNIHAGRASEPIVVLTCVRNLSEPLDPHEMTLDQDKSGHVTIHYSEKQQGLGCFSDRLNFDEISLSAYPNKLIFEIPVKNRAQ